MTTLEVQKEDITKLGHTTFQEDGLTSLLFDVDDDTFWIQEIFMRNVLKDISPDYKILSIDDFTDEDVVIRTNLPWDEYMKIE
jgi:hypothetical protein